MSNEELTKIYFSARHILQSTEWGGFKTLMGTRAIAINNLQLTVHKLPLGFGSIGYAPKIRPEDLDLEKLYEIGKKENCIFVKLDVPHAQREFRVQSSLRPEFIPRFHSEELRARAGFRVVEGKAVFAQSTILMDLTKTDDEILANMDGKTRYNIGLAQKKGVVVKVYPDLDTSTATTFESKSALDNFINLQKETARRQKFFVHPDTYYKTCFETLSSQGMVYLLEAQVSTQNSPFDSAQGRQLTTSPTAASWILFRHGDVLYYPYGESNYKYRSYMPSSLLMWGAIQLGKKLGCKVFDLWGASEDPQDEKDPWYGFTRFKLSFGGLHLKLAPTQDLITNPPLYRSFNLTNDLRWKILRLLK